ncbi:MAG: host attachment family protein [Rhizomicrobium sp.]
MAAKTLPTWIVVLDGAQARFFALRQSEDGQVFEEIAEPLAATPRVVAKPGRSFATGMARGVVEPRLNARKLEKHDFIHEIAGRLDAAAAQKDYSRLILAAPPRSLGELREVLSARVLNKLVHEIPKTLTNLPTDQLWNKLSVMLLSAAKPLPKKSQEAILPAMPVSVVFRSTENSPTVQADALHYAAKLGRKYARIESCKVTISAPRRISLKGKSFTIGLEVMAEGRKIATKGACSGLHSHENAHSALRDVFEAAERKLGAMAGRLASVGARAEAGRRIPAVKRARMQEAWAD